jgi:hypothetical protein
MDQAGEVTEPDAWDGAVAAFFPAGFAAAAAAGFGAPPFADAASLTE